MLNKRPKSLSELVSDGDSTLGRLADAARLRVDLADHLRNRLDSDLAAHLEGCNLRDDGTLVVLTAAPEWASLLRFESEKLLGACRERHPGTTRISFRVLKGHGSDQAKLLK